MSIKIKNLYKNYKGFEAVKNLNFEIKKGSITGLLGPNGCGKTTTIGMILGLIRPTKGEVLINNKDIVAMSFVGSTPIAKYIYENCAKNE